MFTLNAYLNFPGTTEEAFNFYKSVLGGEFTSFSRFKDTPQAANLSPEEGEKLMHVTLLLSNGALLMGTDSLPSMGHTATIGDNVSLSVLPDSEEEANRIFNGLSLGGKIEVPLGKSPWNAYFGMFTDKFGIKWMVNYDYGTAQ